MRLSSTTTNKQIIDLMMARLGDRAAPKLRSNVVLEINTYVDGREMQALLPWFLVKEIELVFLPQTVSTPLPADFIRELEDDQPGVYVDGLMTHQMKKAPADKMLFDNGGPPDAYALVGEEFFIAPRASAEPATFIRFRYLAETPDILDDDQPISNVWLKYAANVVTFGALRVIAGFQIQDPDMANRFAGEEQRALDGLWRANEARQHTNADYMIED
jgi:hypothetical protein